LFDYFLFSFLYYKSVVTRGGYVLKHSTVAKILIVLLVISLVVPSLFYFQP